MRRESKRSGTFKDKLGDYANAFARSEKFDGAKANIIIRDIYKARYSESMKVTLDGLKAREAALQDHDKSLATSHAQAVGQQIEQGDKVSFYRAFDSEAVKLTQTLGVTEATAKTLMKEAFEEHSDQSFYDWGKALEKQYYTPQIEKERAERQLAKNQEQKQSLRQSR